MIFNQRGIAMKGREGLKQFTISAVSLFPVLHRPQLLHSEM